MKIKYTCTKCEKVHQVMPGPMFTCACGRGSGEIVAPSPETMTAIAAMAQKALNWLKAENR